MVAPEERKLATILFADLVGSTELGSSEDPERLRLLLQRFFDAMAAEIEATGGTVEKFIGDAVMAVFGAPASQEDHAERALHTALSMQRRLEELFGGRLALRIGVNTGEVVAGRAREGGSFVSGDAVNVAARLEQAAGPGEILVGGRTVAAVRGAFEFDAATTVAAKGKADGIQSRRLIRALSLMRPRGLAGSPSPFVGRERELATLQEAYLSVVERRAPKLVTLVGDAGVGKSRLIRELWQWLADQEPQPLQRTGRCLSYGQVTYWALGEVLREQLGLRESDRPEAALDRLRGREILGLALGLDVAGESHPLVVRDRFQDAWVVLLEELVAERPAILLIEDLHWAEEQLLDLIEYLLRAVRGPLLLLGTGRPELLQRRPGWGDRDPGATMILDPLDAEAAQALLHRLLGGELPEPLRALAGQAEGNPFFLEELVASLLDRGVLERRNGDWALSALPTGFVVPDTVQAVLAARIDLLEPAEKAALQAASVIGRTFWSGPVYELVEGDAPDLRVLEERDFVRQRIDSSIDGEREFVIKHAVTREVAYASIPRATRARLHARFADWLERFGHGRDEHAPILAHHYTEAARPDQADLAWADEPAELERLQLRAVEWLRRAGALAVGRYELDEGIALLHRALELRPDDEVSGDIWRELGRANALKFDGPAFWEAMQASLRTTSDPDQQAETYSLLAFHTSTRVGMWKRRPAKELVDEWIERALELSARGSPAYVRSLIARVHWHSDYDEAAAIEASTLADALDDPDLRSYAWMARAGAAFEHHRFDEAFEWARRRFELQPDIHDPDHVVEMLETAMPAAAALGRFDEARRVAREHVERSQRLTPHHRVHGIALVVEAEELIGDWEAIRTLTPEIEELVAANEATPCIRNARSLLVAAAAHFAAGGLDEAERLERAAAELGMHSPALLAPRARLALLRGDRVEMRRLLDDRAIGGMTWGLAFRTARLDALAAVRDREALEAEAPTLMHAGTYAEPFALRALAIVRDDDALLARALERFAALGLAWHAAQTEALKLRP